MTKEEYKKLEDFVYNYKTKNKEGFIQSEVDKILMDFPNINIKKFNNAFMGNTCIMKDSQIVNYHCDVLKALLCGIENRDLYGYEFD